MNKLSNYQIFKVYFSNAPFILAEAFFIGSILAFILSTPKIESLIGILCALIAGYFIHNKVYKTRTAIEVIRLGYYTNARLTIISDNDIEHNGRKVKNYSFCFFHKEKAYYYDFNSAYRRSLKKGQTYIVFYHPNNPNLSFIPKLHSIDPKPFLKPKDNVSNNM